MGKIIKREINLSSCPTRTCKMREMSIIVKEQKCRAANNYQMIYYANAIIRINPSTVPA